jgi:hypothetical protein
VCLAALTVLLLLPLLLLQVRPGVNAAGAAGLWGVGVLLVGPPPGRAGTEGRGLEGPLHKLSMVPQVSTVQALPRMLAAPHYWTPPSLALLTYPQLPTHTTIPCTHLQAPLLLVLPLVFQCQLPPLQQGRCCGTC